MRDPRERPQDMLQAIAAIERHLHRGKAAFEQDELLQGRFVRNLALPAEVRSEEAKASYRNGVLEVRVPKSERAKPKKVKVEVS